MRNVSSPLPPGKHALQQAACRLHSTREHTKIAESRHERIAHSCDSLSPPAPWRSGWAHTLLHMSSDEQSPVVEDEPPLDPSLAVHYSAGFSAPGCS